MQYLHCETVLCSSRNIELPRQTSDPGHWVVSLKRRDCKKETKEKVKFLTYAFIVLPSRVTALKLTVESCSLIVKANEDRPRRYYYHVY